MPESSPHGRAPGTWEKIVVATDSRLTEAVAAFLAELSGAGVEISTTPGAPGVVRGNHVSTEEVTAYISLDDSGDKKMTATEKTDELREFLDRLTGIFPECPAPTFTSGILEEEDWSRVWKSFFTTFQVTPTLAIKPSWEEASEKSKAGGEHLVIEMDPGLAFGTGHHASTQLALLLLEELLQNDAGKQLQDILDVGTGSGILAMGCALFGAKNVLAVDNDPDAVAAAEANIARNRLQDRIKASDRDIATLKDEFDLIVANITHDTLAALAPVLSKLLRSEGFLVLSGILKEDQEDSIKKIYTGMGLQFLKSETKDEWAALLLQN